MRNPTVASETVAAEAAVPPSSVAASVAASGSVRRAVWKRSACGIMDVSSVAFGASHAVRSEMLLPAAERAELRGRHALEREELAVEVRHVVEADLVADFRHAEIGLAQMLACELDSQRVDVLHEGHAGVAAEGAREGGDA